MDEVERTKHENLGYALPVALRSILDGFKNAIHHKNTSAVLIVDGRSGMGKSTLSFQIGKYCDPDFNLHKIHWLPETFLNGEDGKIGLSQAKKGDVIIFDEGMILSSRASMSAVNRMIVMAMSMIRSKNIIVIFCVNSIFDLDRNLALSRADILLHCYGESLTSRGRFMAFFKGADGQDRLKMLYLLGKKYYDYGKPKSNFFSTFSSNFVVDEVEYEKQKQQGVNDFLTQTTKKDSSFKNAESRDRYILWIRENTELTIEKIAEIGNISPRTITNILQRYRR